MRRHERGSTARSMAREARRVAQTVVLVLLVLSATLPARAWGRKVQLARKYRPGQAMVYETKLRTRAEVRSNPPELKTFLPPVPLEFSVRQRNTVKVAAVRPDGTADVESRFDRFEIESDLLARLPENLRSSAQQAQQEFSQRVAGQVLTAHYDREGRLLEFEGADTLLEELDAPLREPLRHALRLLLEQTGGNTVYPDHRVKPGEEWKRKLTAPASESYPFKVEGESTLRYAGKTRYRGVRAAIVDIRFVNVLSPATDPLRRAGPLAQLEAQGMELEMRIDGQGQGRLLLALDDGRVLQNRSTIRQTLSAQLKGQPGLPLPASQPMKLEIQSDTEMEMEGTAK